MKLLTKLREMKHREQVKQQLMDAAKAKLNKSDEHTTMYNRDCPPQIFQMPERTY